MAPAPAATPARTPTGTSPSCRYPVPRPTWPRAAALVGVLGTERVDVVDLGTASALLRFRAAPDGVVVVERVPGAFLRFRQEAVRFWCDAGPVIRAAQDDVLARLG